LLAEALALQPERRLGPDEDPAPYAETLETEYKAKLADLESRHRAAVQRLYGHREIDAHTEELELLESDLFSEGTWLQFGLRRRDRSAKVTLDAGEERALAGHFASLQKHAPGSPRHTAVVEGTVRIAEAILRADQVRETETESR
jgi:hypothetical protein